MEKPTAPEQPSGDAQTPLSFSLNQAAALCGVSTHELWEWTTCGYVRTAGSGDHRRYDEEALRQIVALREAIRAATGPAAKSPLNPAIGPQDDQGGRADEFSVAAVPMDDAHLTLQTEMFFALNAGVGVSANDLAKRFQTDSEQTLRVLGALVQSRQVMRVHRGSETVFQSSRAQLHGPSVREQRIRATRRPRVASRPL